MLAPKKIVIIIAFVFYGQGLFSQRNNYENIEFNKNAFYIICRGTKQKLGLIAEKFNASDKNITHVGIGILEKDVLNVYNVTNLEPEESALLVETIGSFLSLSDIHYFGIWEYKIADRQLERMRKILANTKLRKISFDMDFNESDDENLYCSEFCAKVLMKCDKKNFNFQLRETVLDNFYAVVLNRKTLRYYPVDFFQSNKKFTKIFEQFF